MRAMVVCGAREALADDWYDAVDATIGWDDAVLIHGACGVDADTQDWTKLKGIDAIARTIAEYRDFELLEMPAAWGRLGKAAGPVRNGKMLDVLMALGECGYEIAVLAFHDNVDHSSRGTKNMVARARMAGVPFAVYDRNGRAYQEGNAP